MYNKRHLNFFLNSTKSTASYFVERQAIFFVFVPNSKIVERSTLRRLVNLQQLQMMWQRSNNLKAFGVLAHRYWHHV